MAALQGIQRAWLPGRVRLTVNASQKGFERQQVLALDSLRMLKSVVKRTVPAISQLPADRTLTAQSVYCLSDQCPVFISRRLCSLTQFPPICRIAVCAAVSGILMRLAAATARLQ